MTAAATDGTMIGADVAALNAPLATVLTGIPVTNTVNPGNLVLVKTRRS